MTRTQHGARIVLLMAFAAGLLGWKSAHTAILYADGLRYIRQAQQIDRGSLVDGLLRAIDHPVYPAAIAVAHRFAGGEGPEAWQAAAQLAAVLAGVLLVVPLYLVTVEMFGERVGWLACLLASIVPLTGQVLADALSESTFLLFWTGGLWTALRFLRRGAFGWLPPTIGFAALAYLTRPEGLLLPAALIATLAAMPLLRSTRLNWPRWWAAVGFLVIGPALLVGPYVAIKGGLGTKPAIARLLGTAPQSAADAVERQRPLMPDQSTTETYAEAAKAVFESVRDAVTIPLLPLALVGLWASRPFAARARPWLFVTIILVATLLALVRLHATGGYCSPRHAMVLALLIVPAAAAGLDHLLTSISLPGHWLGLGEGKVRPGPAFWMLIVGGLAASYAPTVLAPINVAFGGYRAAGAWVAEHVPAEDKVVDVTGWALFYGSRPGYTFGDLLEAPLDPAETRWVVVREAHLGGKWWYSRQFRHLLGLPLDAEGLAEPGSNGKVLSVRNLEGLLEAQGAKLVAEFPGSPQRGHARVFVIDRLGETHLAQKGAGEAPRH